MSSLDTIDAATALTPLPASLPNHAVYKSEIKRSWCVGPVPHGGNLLCILARAVTTTVHSYHASLKQPHITTYNAEFLSRAIIGPVTVEVLPLKLGKQFSLFRTKLVQQHSEESPAKLCVEAIFTITNLGTPTAGAINVSTPPLLSEQEFVRRDDCQEFTTPPHWKKHVPATVKAETLIPKSPASKQQNLITPYYQWVRWYPTSHNGVFTIDHLPYLADDLRPLIRAKEMQNCMFTTLNCGMDIRRAGVNGKEGWEWLFVKIVVSEVRDGRCGFEATFADESGDIVGIARQVLLIMPTGKPKSERL